MLTLEIKTGFVYVLKSTLLGGYKIGITTSPSSRFKALAVGSKAELVGYWSVDAYRELEKQLHKEYADKRVPQSEWFDLTDKELLEVISKISSLGFPEYIEPETAKVIEYKPHYKVIKTLRKDGAGPSTATPALETHPEPRQPSKNTTARRAEALGLMRLLAAAAISVRTSASKPG